MSMHLIGLISDTHGLLRPAAVEALQGVEHILHAGDVGDLEVLAELRRIAPVTAVRGNVDNREGVRDLHDTEVFSVEGTSIFMLHNLNDLEINPAAALFKAVLYGHSHQASVTRKNGVMYINPGSAGPNRFNLKASLALMKIQDDAIDVEIITLS